MSQHGNSRAAGPTDSELLAIGKLQFLASFCPLHQKMPALALARIFYPALNNGCVRFFENEHGKTAAALIWARLSDEVSDRLLRDGILPSEAEWSSGNTLWFLDLIAPFGHARVVARTIARSPPDEPFWFARIDQHGTLRKVVRGDVLARHGTQVATWHGSDWMGGD
ncbi:Hemolysin-activating lysine-acyltransferase HlyC [Shimia sp. SK013]|uniref:toxin-activating lysine-acyltransferase n=1 Tax=Shimia sp. SK013 TaxID=1389006 RepID=UPI0006B57214|nr:toxin-activating lysine-acyltransferase [Shimia sp. SK013]KPA22238.1 Hemolysin-activating lysine-acyltransferase HlyC [Shimia sp. SK013]